MENPGEPWPRPALFTETLSCPCKSGCPRHRSPSAGKALAPSQARESTGNRAAATEMGSQRGRALPSFQRPGPTCSVLPSLPPAETSRDTAETLHRGEKKARCSLFFFFSLPRSLQCNSQGAGGTGGHQVWKTLVAGQERGDPNAPSCPGLRFWGSGPFPQGPNTGREAGIPQPASQHLPGTEGRGRGAHRPPPSGSRPPPSSGSRPAAPADGTCARCPRLRRAYRCAEGPVTAPRRWRVAMAYSTCCRVAMVSCLVLCVSLLLPRTFLSRGGGRQEPGAAPLAAPAPPEGKRPPRAPPPAAAAPLRRGQVAPRRQSRPVPRPVPVRRGPCFGCCSGAERKMRAVAPRWARAGPSPPARWAAGRAGPGPLGSPALGALRPRGCCCPRPGRVWAVLGCTARLEGALPPGMKT